MVIPCIEWSLNSSLSKMLFLSGISVLSEISIVKLDALQRLVRKLKKF